MFFANSFLDRIENLDRQLFTLINGRMSNSFLDSILPYCRSPVFWVPLYLFMLVFVLMNFGIKGLWWCIFFICTVALTDLTGNYVFKQGFERLRPCNDPELSSQLRLLVEHCGTGYSFVSNHAANHFGMAVFVIMTFGNQFKKWVWLALVWAFIVGYAQVYIGVHYPFDIVAGALMGAGWAYLMGHTFNKRFRFTIFGNQPVA